MAKILIIDDDSMVRELLKMTLSPQHTILESPDAETALEMIESEPPDLILLDWVLPGLSGVHIVRLLRRNQRWAEIPVIIISARGEEQTRTLAHEYNLSGHLAKPFDVNELRLLVSSALERRGR